MPGVIDLVRFFRFPFAVSGDREDVPDGMQASGKVSFEAGYGFDYERDPASDPNAKEIERLAMNQLFYLITAALRQYQAQGTYPYITPEQNGGAPFAYGKAALCLYDDGSGLERYESLINNNTALPTDTSKWRRAGVTFLQEYIVNSISENSSSENKLDAFLGWYIFSGGIHPVAKPGMGVCDGRWIDNIEQAHPKIVEYLLRPENQILCVTPAEYEALNTHVWHTNADGTKVGFDGIGGVAKYCLDLVNGRLRLPDLRGMSPEMAGCDLLGVGLSGGDQMRALTGRVIRSLTGTHSGVFYGDNPRPNQRIAIETGYPSEHDICFDASRVVPTGPRNRGRSWGSNMAVWLGLPS